MSSIEQLIEGLKIFAKYNGDVSAEHDIIYASPNRMRDEQISQEDQDKLNELEWKFNDGLEAWMAFWPCSVISTLLNDPIRRLFRYLFNLLKSLYQKMADAVFADDPELK